MAARTGRRRHAHQPRRGTFEQQAHRHQQQRDRRRKRRADEGRRGSGDDRSSAPNTNPSSTVRATSPPARISHSDGRARALARKSNTRARRPDTPAPAPSQAPAARVRDGIDAASDDLIDVAVDAERVLRDGHEPDRQHDQRGEQRQRLAHGAGVRAIAHHAGAAEQQQRQPRVRRHGRLRGHQRREQTGPARSPRGARWPQSTPPARHNQRPTLAVRACADVAPGSVTTALALTLRPTSGEAIRRWRSWPAPDPGGPGAVLSGGARIGGELVRQCPQRP